MDLLTDILASREFAAFVVLCLTGAAAWLAKTVRTFLNGRLTAEQLRLLFAIAERAVQYAEQTAEGRSSAEKLATAMNAAQIHLDAYGIKVSVTQLAAAIESAVWSEFNALPEISSTDPAA